MQLYQAISTDIKTKHERLELTAWITGDIDDKMVRNPDGSGSYQSLDEEQRHERVEKEAQELREQLLDLTLLAEAHLSDDEITQIQKEVPMSDDTWTYYRTRGDGVSVSEEEAKALDPSEVFQLR